MPASRCDNKRNGGDAPSGRGRAARRRAAGGRGRRARASGGARPRGRRPTGSAAGRADTSRRAGRGPAPCPRRRTSPPGRPRRRPLRPFAVCDASETPRADGRRRWRRVRLALQTDHHWTDRLSHARTLVPVPAETLPVLNAPNRSHLYCTYEYNMKLRYKYLVPCLFLFSEILFFCTSSQRRF